MEINNKILVEKINCFEKEISHLKNDKKVLKENKETLKQQNSNNIPLENRFEEIENPWTTEKDLSNNIFDYYLKNNNYYAERDDKQCKLNIIKSKHLFEINKIYKLKYDINYKNNRFRIGFGDFCERDRRLQTKNTVGLSNAGLFVEGKHYDHIKIEINTKEIIFIINLKENSKHFELFIDGKSYGIFNITIDKIYGLAAFKCGSATINTSRSSI